MLQLAILNMDAFLLYGMMLPTLPLSALIGCSNPSLPAVLRAWSEPLEPVPVSATDYATSLCLHTLTLAFPVWLSESTLHLTTAHRTAVKLARRR